MHGKDDVSFFVDGSRWFLGADDCERFKDESRPLALEFVSRMTSYLAENPRIQGPRTRVLGRVDLNERFRPNAGTRPGVCERISASRRPVGYMGGPDRGLLTIEGATGRKVYDYEGYPDPRGLWLSERGAGTDRVRGEFRYIRSFDVEDRSIQVGNEVWYREPRDCERARARLSSPQ